MISVKTKTAAPVAVKRRLSPYDFEKICREAAHQSLNCREYICGVLSRLCSWLNIPDGTLALRNECQLDDGNLQIVVLALYRLLEERCLYNFDVQAILNSHTDGEP